MQRNVADFGMDTITLAGPLESKLQASKAAGFSQIMLWAKDLASYPGGLDQAVRVVKESGIRVTGIQKLDIAKNMLQLCKAVGAPLLMVCSTTSSHADADMTLIARHLAKLATLAVPLGVKVGFEALSWGRHINQYPQSWEAVALADHANLGV
eukprot:gene31191-40149_t